MHQHPGVSSSSATAAWPPSRAHLHARQRTGALAEPWDQLTTPEKYLARLFNDAIEAYDQAVPDSQVVTFTLSLVTFAFDLAANENREPRPVAAYAKVIPAAPVRDRSRQARHPLEPGLVAAGYDRGHLVAHASGGGLDANIFAQAAHVNRGRSPQGKRYRRLETLAARCADGVLLHRLIYGDGSTVPDLTELTVFAEGRIRAGVFDNRPTSWIPDTEQLRRGTRFHRQVQRAFLAELVGAEARPEHSLTITEKRAGRVDLFVVPAGRDRHAVIVEIKSTDWDARPNHRVRPLILAHIRQLQTYLDVYVAKIAHLPGRADTDGPLSGGYSSVSGTLLYPRRPSDQWRVELIDELAGRESLMVVWFDETDWGS